MTIVRNAASNPHFGSSLAGRYVTGEACLVDGGETVTVGGV